MKKWLALGMICSLCHAGADTLLNGGLVLQFDDGWTLWRTLVAPELARAGGKATAYINNQNIHNGRITFDDLRALQDEFGWEIGTHTFNHHNAIRYVRQHGLEDWLENQLDRSISEMADEGLHVRQLAFPYNAYTPEISRAALDRVKSYRRADQIAIAPGQRTDGSLPGTAIDLSYHLPTSMILRWIDAAQARGQLLFLYGHRVLPDDHFVTGRVIEVTAREIVADADIVLPTDEGIVLVPDIMRSGRRESPGNLTVEGARIRIPEGGPDLTQMTAPGATFLIGPAYGTRLSDFRVLIDYASERLHFYTVSEALGLSNGEQP